ncbi:MAG: hypothetical protein EOP07_09030 [Proteobacteria bacterium]|nr:MAG: hypothetical protein EOP07_09030 [Pseudomonadota bacterium]
MVSRLGQFVWGMVSLSLLASCAKEQKKFNLSQPHQERQLIVTYKQGTLRNTITKSLHTFDAEQETLNSESVLVGIVDSGMDYNHPDLKDNVWSNPGETGLDANGKDKRTNGIDDDGNGFVDDWHGWDFYNNDNDPMDDNSHGTHVAGTIGAVGNNESGIVGVNWSVSMVPIKVFSGGGATSTDMLVKGIEYATTLGVFVSNNSWGGGAYSDAIYSAIKKASDKGILFAAAAGNEGENNDVGDHYPSNYDLPNIISVAAINRKDNVSAFSNYGANTVDVAAPGEDIYSTLPNGLYGLKSGTSMATPHVTGAIALIRSRYPLAKALEIKEKLLASTVKTNALDGRVIYGRINVANSMETDVTPPSIVTGLDVIQAGLNNISITWNSAGDDGDAGDASSYVIRMSDAPLTTTAEWDAAEPAILSELKRSNSVYTASIKNLVYNRSAYITIRAIDNVGNVSDLSESIAFSLVPVDMLWSEENDTKGNWDAFGSPWGISKIGDISVISDSPDAFYANGSDKSAVTQDITLNSSDLVLEVRMKYELEKDYDWGYIELSVDSGLTWKEVGKVTGASAWTTSSYNLKDAIGSAKSFRLRLRLKSDQSVNYDGWDIDSLKIVGQKG